MPIMRVISVLVSGIALSSACAGAGSDSSDGGAGPETGLQEGGTEGGADAGKAAADGAAAKTCKPDEISCGGACVVTSSCSFSVTSLDPPTGWQSGRGYVTLHGSGFVAGTTVSIADGRAPARIVDATKILIETPPGPVGSQDVTVSVSGAKAVLRGGFTYQTAGLTPPWQQRGLTTGRVETSVAVLQDGRALIAGGLAGLAWSTAVDTADIYTEPGAAAVVAANSMSTQRFIPAAVTLLTGKVVVAGGACQLSSATDGCIGNLKSVDVFDPSTNKFTPSAASLPDDSVAVQGILLVDGRVLFLTNSAPRAAIYDPGSDSIKVVPVPVAGPYGIAYPFLVRLRDGRVLLGAGALTGTGSPGSYTFLFDSSSDAFTATGSFAVLRFGATANTLPDGRVVVMGGADPSSNAPLDTVEFYDPVAETFSLAPYKMSVPRAGHASVLVRDGTVLAIAGATTAGGYCTTLGTWTATVDQIDPVAGKITPFPALAQPVQGITGVVMTDGSVLVAGGAQCGVAPEPYVDFLQGAMIR